jgi:predicted Rossmann-fold nucleotide-binding protein
VRKTRGRVVHIETVDDLDRRLGAGATRLGGWRIHGLDLSDRVDALLERRLGGATFLGCTFAEGQVDRVHAAGGLVLPALAGVPVDPYRPRLYTADELYDAAAYEQSFDARAYAWSQRRGGQDDMLARTLHDHAVDDALSAWVADRHLVGVMGGHAAARGEPAYAEAARLGHGLGRSLVVATGGGPGAMEAANLGARLAGEPVETAMDASARLAATPSYRPSVDAWLESARAVVAEHPQATETLGVPTWHYGHEPSNAFATVIAKYLGNPTREAILLEICDAGIVFLPGAAGTVQEVFQDACQAWN